MKKYQLIIITLISLIVFQACEDFFGSKQDPITDEIFEQGRRDPLAADEVVGYSALLPFWTNGFQNPNDIIVGYDELIYVTDDQGLHVLDQAGRRYQLIPLDGANAVAMDRNLHVYVSARQNFTITNNNNVTDDYNLPVVYKLKNANGAGELAYVDTLAFPFDDSSLSTFSAQVRRLDKTREDNYEQVQITGITVLADNNVYLTRTGPSNLVGQIAAPDNIVLEFQRIVTNGELTEKMRNIRLIRTINPTNASLISGIGLSSIASFIGPPQRETMTDDRGFLITQSDQNAVIPYRVLWVTAEDTPDGLVFAPNTDLLAQDTSRADNFLYETFKFQNPTDIVYTTDGTNYILVTDAAKDSLYLFQSNGYEGVNPPIGSNLDKVVNVSFGGEGTGPKQFNEPTAVAYFRQIVYVVDKLNNRVCRYKLSTDFE